MMRPIAVVAAVTLMLSARSEAVVLTKIADASSTPALNNSLQGAPNINNGWVTFGSGGSATQPIEIYRWHAGTLERIVDDSTPVPGTHTSFGYIAAPQVDSQGNVAFTTQTTRPGSGAGVYVYDAALGSVRLVADTATQVPGRTIEFINFEAAREGPSISNGRVALYAQGGSPTNPVYGIYTDLGGGLRAVAEVDFGNPVPGRLWQSLGWWPRIDGSRVAFGAADQSTQGLTHGLYVWNAQTNHVSDIVNNLTLVPGGTGSFGLGYLGGSGATIEGGSIAFWTTSANLTIPNTGQPFSAGQGIYTTVGGTLRRVADTSTPVPGGSGTFKDFAYSLADIHGVSLDGGRIAFAARDQADKLGIYMEQGGVLTKVIAVGDVINGKTLTSLGWTPYGYSAFSDHGLDGNHIVFYGSFDNESPPAVYLLDIVASPPPPSDATRQVPTSPWWALLSVAVGLTAFAARRQGAR